MPQMQQSISNQQQDPLHPQQLAQVFLLCLFTIISVIDIFIFAFANNI